MSVGFLLPDAFAALLALALPLLIHLARRSEQRPTDFAALRWLRERPRPRHRIRLDELPLLLLRLLLLSAVILWLARPVLFGSVDRAPWVVALPGVDTAAVIADAPERAEVRWLAPGLPSLDEPAPTAPPFASLLRQLDSELPTGVPLRVVVPEQLQGADAERPRLSRTVEWRVVPGAMPAPAPARLQVAAMSVRYDAGRDVGLRYIRAAGLALRSPGFAAEPTTQPLPANSRNLVWLSRQPLPQPVVDWVEKGGTVLLAAGNPSAGQGGTVLWRDGSGRPLVQGGSRGSGRILRFTRPLVPAEMPELLEPDFPRHLAALFTAAPPPPSRVYARDYAPLPGGLPPGRPAREIQPWLALLVAALFIAERWLATRRARATAP